MNTIVSCDGLSDWGINIPPFALRQGELVGVALPIDFGLEWYRIMNAFCGIERHDGITTSCVGELLNPATASERYVHQPKGATVLNVVRKRAETTTDVAKTLLGRFGIEYSQPIQAMGAGERYLIGIAESLAATAELIVITTSGLSTLSYLRIISALHSARENASSIVFFHTCDFDYFGPTDPCGIFEWYDKIVECEIL